MTIIFNLLLLFVIVILLPTTHQPTTSSILVSPNLLHLSQIRPFTMTDFTPITDWSFKFANHPHCPAVVIALNNTYAEDVEAAAIDSIFTDANRTVVVANVINVIRGAIVDTILLLSSDDQTVVAPIINHTPLFGLFSNPSQKIALPSAGSFSSTLNATITATKTGIVVWINTASIWVDCSTYNAMNFD